MFENIYFKTLVLLYRIIFRSGRITSQRDSEISMTSPIYLRSTVNMNYFVDEKIKITTI